MSESEVELSTELGKPILPWPNFQKYFRVLRVIEDNFFYKKLEVKCLSCISAKSYKVDSRSNSNLR